MAKGLTLAGNIIVDSIKHIDKYPGKGMLVDIKGVERSVGGCAFNTSVDLKKLAPSLRVNVLGVVGDDDNGKFALGLLEESGLDISRITVIKGGSTSFTDVMQDDTCAERTFFTFGGVSDVFDYGFIDYDAIDTDMFHIGYALLLKGMDAYDPEYGTQLARTLARVSSMGIETSFDAVSNVRPDAKEIIRASLKRCDRVVFNEIEAGAAVGLPVRDADNTLIKDNIRPVLERLMEAGVRKAAVIHCPEYGFAMDSCGEYFERESLKLPKGFIAGTAGAGDAFCAGMLLGFHDGMPMYEALGFSAGAAAASLRRSGGTEGMTDRDGVKRLIEELGG